MASSSGNSSGSTMLQTSGSEEELQMLLDERKRKRMQSNRESARRSRMRRQQNLDDLIAQVANLRKENSEILAAMNMTTQYFLKVEAENSILRAQTAELTQRLQFLAETLDFISAGGEFFEPLFEPL